MSKGSLTDQGVFPTTRWSLVLATRQYGEGARLALNDLCQRYWRPVRNFFGRHVGMEGDSEDLAQEYFASLLAREYLDCADQARGRFRAFLVQDMKHFLWHTLAKRRTKKRGGDVVFVPMDASVTQNYEEAANMAAFDRQWALEIVRSAREQLRAEYVAGGKGELFSLLQQGLVKSLEAADYEQWALRMNMTPGALKVALHRLRGRFRKALEDQVWETVSSEEDFADEMRHLRHALRDASPEENEAAP